MFPLGQTIITGAALKLLQETGISPESLIQRHVLGDWGDMTDSDKKTNDLAVEMGGRILSAYNIPDGTVVWVTTDPQRETTTVLLPGEN